MRTPVPEGKRGVPVCLAIPHACWSCFFSVMVASGRVENSANLFRLHKRHLTYLPLYYVGDILTSVSVGFRMDLMSSDVLFICVCVLLLRQATGEAWSAAWSAACRTQRKMPRQSVAAAKASRRDRKSTRLNSSHSGESRMPSSA